MGDTDSRGMASLDPSGFIRRIYVGDRWAMLWASWLQRRFSHYKSMAALSI